MNKIIYTIPCIIALILTLLVTGCGESKPQEKSEVKKGIAEVSTGQSIEIGMSMDEVMQVLGEPDSKRTETKDLLVSSADGTMQAPSGSKFHVWSYTKEEKPPKHTTFEVWFASNQDPNNPKDVVFDTNLLMELDGGTLLGVE